jgi:hypothetical protein
VSNGRHATAVFIRACGTIRMLQRSAIVRGFRRRDAWRPFVPAGIALAHSTSVAPGRRFPVQRVELHAPQRQPSQPPPLCRRRGALSWRPCDPLQRCAHACRLHAQRSRVIA